MTGSRRSRSLAALALLGSVLVVTTAVGSVSAASYSITTADGIDLPQRTVTVEGTEYTVSELGRTPQGESIEVTVDTTDSDYNIYLYKVTADGVQIEQTRDVSGTTTVTFPTTGLSPGSYFAAVYDGGIRKIVPIVLSGYDITADVPQRVERGETAQVTASVTPQASSGDPARVQAVVGNSETAIRVNATKTADGYVAEVPTDDLSAGEYAAYVVARGESETEDGQKILVGVSDAFTLTVTEPTSTSDSGNGDSGGSSDDTSSGASGGTSGGTSGGSTGSGSSTATPSLTPAVTPTSTPAPSPTLTSSPASTPTRSPSPTEPDDGVVTPASETPTASQTPTDGGGPGFGLLAALLALAVVALLGRRG